jgi:hypothetical protein
MALMAFAAVSAAGSLLAAKDKPMLLQLNPLPQRE